MKLLLGIKCALVCALFTLIGTAAFAQAQPLRVNNHTNCWYRVEVKAADEGSCDKCAAGTICIAPMSSAAVPPCGTADYFYAVAVTPMLGAGCTTPFGTGAGAVYNVVDFCWPTLPVDYDDGEHDLCGPFEIAFSSAYSLEIY